MEYKELLEIIRDNFKKEYIYIHEETYINTKYPLIYIKPKNYSIESELLQYLINGNLNYPQNQLVKK